MWDECGGEAAVHFEYELEDVRDLEKEELEEMDTEGVQYHNEAIAMVPDKHGHKP